MTKAPPMQGDEIDDDGYADAHGHSTTIMPLKVFREQLRAAEARGYEQGKRDGGWASYEKAFKKGYERCREEAAKVVDDAANAGPELVAFAGVKHWARSVAAAIRSLKP